MRCDFSKVKWCGITTQTQHKSPHVFLCQVFRIVCPQSSCSKHPPDCQTDFTISYNHSRPWIVHVVILEGLWQFLRAWRSIWSLIYFLSWKNVMIYFRNEINNGSFKTNSAIKGWVLNIPSEPWSIQITQKVFLYYIAEKCTFGDLLKCFPSVHVHSPCLLSKYHSVSGRNHYVFLLGWYLRPQVLRAFQNQVVCVFL